MTWRLLWLQGLMPVWHSPHNQSSRLWQFCTTRKVKWWKFSELKPSGCHDKGQMIPFSQRVPAEHIYLWWRRALRIPKGSESTHSASWEHILLPLQVRSSSVTRRLIPPLAETLHSWTCGVAWTASNHGRPQLADGARQNGVGTAEHSLILDVCQKAAEMFKLPLVSASINTQTAINNKTKTVFNYCDSIFVVFQAPHEKLCQHRCLVFNLFICCSSFF